ncbi:MAG: ATP-binding protein [Bacteroidetes bacterium]|nr:ATP-binding protein [Bacteroidota bacterium]
MSPLSLSTRLLDPAAPIGQWDGASEPGSTGVRVLRGYSAFAVFEVPRIPNFQAARFTDFKGKNWDEIVSAVAKLQQTWLGALFHAGPFTALSMRFVSGIDLHGNPKVRLFLIGRAWGSHQAEAEAALAHLTRVLEGTFPNAYTLNRLTDASLAIDAEAREVLGLEWVNSMVEVLRPEQTFSASHDRSLTGFSFYYLPLPFRGDASSTGRHYCEHMTKMVAPGERVALDFTLIPTTPLTEVERSTLIGWKGIAETWSKEQTFETGGGLYTKPQKIQIAPDPSAEPAKKAYEALLKEMGEYGSELYLFAVRILSSSHQPPLGIASGATSEFSMTGSSHYLAPVPRDHPAFAKALRAAQYLYVTPAVYSPIWDQLDAPETLRRMHRIAALKEVGAVFRMPIGGEQGVTGMEMDDGILEVEKSKGKTEASSESRPYEGNSVSPKPLDRRVIHLGHVIETGRLTQTPVDLDLEVLKKHLFVVGQPGSGKTTFCFSLLHQLWTKFKIPFLVIEPAKKEYRALRTVAGMEDMLVFTVGNELVSPLRLNPLEVPPGVLLTEHIAQTKAALSAGLDMPEPLPGVFGKSMEQVYRDLEWSELDVGGETSLSAPSLADLYSVALNEVRKLGYGKDVESNFEGMIRSRLGPLVSGIRSWTLNTERSMPLDFLLQRPVVIELDSLNDSDKNAIVLLLLSQIRTYVMANRRTRDRSEPSLTHLTVIEEAHNVAANLPASSPQDPRVLSAKFIARMLAELRALGEGIVVADQLPTAVAPEVVKNTNTKVMNRLVSLDDRQVLGATMNLSEWQVQMAASLNSGQGFVTSQALQGAPLVQQPNFKHETAADQPLLDSELRENLRPLLEAPDLLVANHPFALCNLCCEGRLCDPRIRDRSARSIEKSRPDVERKFAQSPSSTSTAGLLAAREVMQPKASRTDVATGCHWVHFKKFVDSRFPQRSDQ